MVDNPDHAAYVIDWYTLQDFNNFESSPACVDFLRNLPESDMAAAVEDSSSRLGHLNLDHGSASHPTSPEKSRFRLYKHSTRAATRELEGLVTLTAFSVPAKIDDNDSTFLELLSCIRGQVCRFQASRLHLLDKAWRFEQVHLHLALGARGGQLG
ncbi:hypothetical protein MY10362_006812 [Beauveria mimosiformis]